MEKNGAAMTPGEMMAEMLRDRVCQDCVSNTSTLGIVCVAAADDCYVKVALAAHASGEYTEVVTERLRDLLIHLNGYRQSMGVQLVDADREIAHLQAKDGGEDE